MFHIFNKRAKNILERSQEIFFITDMPKKTYALCKIQHIVQLESPCFMGSRALIGV
ncbi:hypothetical protein EMIT0P43_190002 [Pseudomonas jessenii]